MVRKCHHNKENRKIKKKCEQNKHDTIFSIKEMKKSQDDLLEMVNEKFTILEAKISNVLDEYSHVKVDIDKSKDHYENSQAFFNNLRNKCKYNI